MISKIAAISILTTILIFQGITMSSAQIPQTFYTIGGGPDGGDCTVSPFNGVWNSNTKTCSVIADVTINAGETLTVLDSATLAFRGNIGGMATLLNYGAVINNGSTEFIGGTGAFSGDFVNRDGATVTNNGKMKFTGGDGSNSGELYTNDVIFNNYGKMSFIGGVGPASAHYTSIETQFNNYGEMKFVGGIGETTAIIFMSGEDDGLTIFENYCGASIEMIGGSGEYSGSIFNGGILTSDPDGIILTPGTGPNSGVLLGDPIQFIGCYCNDSTIDELLASPFFTNVIDNRDGSLGVILEGKKKENNLILASDIGGTIVGGDKADCLIGGDGNDIIFGGKGNDQMYGGGEVDVLRGGGGSDKISGGDGNDLILGGQHKDRISGGNGDDDIFGEKGKDTLKGDSGVDTMDGGDNQDTCIIDADDPAPTTCEIIS